MRGSVDLMKKAFHLRADLYHFHDPELLLLGILYAEAFHALRCMII